MIFKYDNHETDKHFGDVWVSKGYNGIVFILENILNGNLNKI